MLDAMTAGRIGFIDTPGQRIHCPPGVTWCADNGCYGKGWPGYAQWFAWLHRRSRDADTCLFATAPDVVGQAAATLHRSEPWLPRIRGLGYRAALVAQDGLEHHPVPWDDFDALFIGGTTTWKLGPHAAALATEARARGKWVHMGRVNSARRYAHAVTLRCDSADGTILTFGPNTNLTRVLDWQHLNDQLPLRIT